MPLTYSLGYIYKDDEPGVNLSKLRFYIGKVYVGGGMDGVYLSEEKKTELLEYLRKLGINVEETEKQKKGNKPPKKIIIVNFGNKSLIIKENNMDTTSYQRWFIKFEGIDNNLLNDFLNLPYVAILKCKLWGSECDIFKNFGEETILKLKKINPRNDKGDDKRNFKVFEELSSMPTSYTNVGSNDLEESYRFGGGKSMRRKTHRKKTKTSSRKRKNTKKMVKHTKW